MLGDNARTAAKAPASGLARVVKAAPIDEAMTVQTLLRRFLNDESAATAIEYALIVSLIAVVAVGVLQATGVNLKGLLNKIAGEV